MKMVVDQTSTLSKTPPNLDNADVVYTAHKNGMAPYYFKRKNESRFQFARSVDPKIDSDLEEIQVPKRI